MGQVPMSIWTGIATVGLLTVVLGIVALACVRFIEKPLLDGLAAVTTIVVGLGVLISGVVWAEVTPIDDTAASQALTVWAWIGVGGVVLWVAASRWGRRSFHRIAIVVGLAFLVLVVHLGRHGEFLKDQAAARRDAEANAETLSELLKAHDEQVQAAIEDDRAKARAAALAALHAFLRSPQPLLSFPIGCTGAGGGTAIFCDALRTIDKAIKIEPPLPEDLQKQIEKDKENLDGLKEPPFPAATTAALASALDVTLNTGPDRKSFDVAVTEARYRINTQCLRAGVADELLSPTNRYLSCNVGRMKLEPGPTKSFDELEAESLLALAEVEATMPAANADSKAKKKADETLAKAQAALEASRSDRDRPALVPALQVAGSGAEELLRATPLGGGQVPVGVSAAAGVLALALALALVRWLETLNGERGAASVQFGTLAGKAKAVTTTDKGDEKEEDWDYGPAFRRYVVGNVAEPRTLPGSPASSGVTDILDAGDAATKLLAKFLKAAQGLIAVQPRFTIDANYLERLDIAKGSEARHEVFVRVSKGRNGESVASRAIIGNTAGVATRAAGYWAAATVISNDRTVPAWASWSPSTYRALAALDGVAGLEPEDRLPLLAEAVGHDPDSGLILMQLAHELELASKPLAAFQLSVRAVICHPHYLEARYRLIASLAMMADRVDSEVARTGGYLLDPTTWASLIDALDRLRPLGTTWTDPSSGNVGTLRTAVPLLAQPERLGRALLAIAKAESAQLGKDLDWKWCFWRSLNRSERTTWLSLVLTRQGRVRRKATKATLKSMARSLQIRNQRLAAPVGSPTNIPTSSEVLHWQAAYNHACSLSIAVSSSVANALTFPKRHTQALQMLDRTRELPGGGALTRAWVSIDPDLASLHGLPAFSAFLDTLPQPTNEPSEPK